jgi:acetyl-CoA/propionyl-CoA carboxylase carboxyl transferase subunit
MSVLTTGNLAAPETERDPRDPLVRLTQLLDPDDFELMSAASDVEVRTAAGRINGRPVIAYCTNATKMGGALSTTGARRIVEAIETGVRERCPVIGVWHSGGAKLADGVTSMDAVGRMFSAMTRASGRVPQISVVVGPAAGAAAYGPALTDLIIVAPVGRLFITGPDVVKSVTGEQIDMEGLGGSEVHSRRSGVAHLTADSEAHAYLRARRLVTFFTRPGILELDRLGEERDLRELLPESPRRAYDVRPLVRAILDPDDGFDELQPLWARNMVTGLGRLAGRTIGVLANNPIRKGGCLDSLSAEKAARFVRTCDSLGVPLLVIVDVPGYLPGVSQEWNGVVRRGAKLLHAFAESQVPRVTLVTRKSYGGAYIAMNSRALGATSVFAWPGAEMAVMGAEAAVKILHKKKLAAAADDEREELLSQLTAEHERLAGGPDHAIAIGVLDEVISPRHTRRRLAEAFATAPAGRGQHGNIPLLCARRRRPARHPPDHGSTMRARSFSSRDRWNHIALCWRASDATMAMQCGGSVSSTLGSSCSPVEFS